MVSPDYGSSLSVRKRNVVNMCWYISFFSSNRDCIVSQLSFSSLEDLKMNIWMDDLLSIRSLANFGIWSYLIHF